MDSSAYGFIGAPIIHGGKPRKHRLWRIAGVFTPTNLIALTMLMMVAVVALGAVVPYRLINTSEVCVHCGGYRYSTTRLYGGVCVLEERIFVHTRSSKLYEELVAANHPHDWLLSGECAGVGNLLEQREVKVIKGPGLARAEQLEQSLLALSESTPVVD